ncbi:exosortase-associated protein EpsI, B-type [Rhodoferax sp.]|uniref:exosortase-associated protein EpsI, B-type n=1 Tax=Rhodoferax sp. TaxID=50421 RepID=UPI002ACD689C|nr:exosortase-associated protein EpsI, B-type [Rhodoferax sp.]MDZ7919084.1 EpsI family protein [Rhodoferax sp.]
MRHKKINLYLFALMVCASLIAWYFVPRAYMADKSDGVDLETIIPEKFGEWQALKQSSNQIINPQLQEKLDSLYSQILTRTYINVNGHRIMLSIAYGKDQRSYMAVHYPEVCYPAQGFTLKSNRIAKIDINGSPYNVRRIETQLGSQRFEPVTYWTTIGDYRSLGGFKKRLLELQYGFSGKIPDGLLLRVSSIGQDTPKQFSIQDDFLSALIEAVQEDQRKVLTGLREI